MYDDREVKINIQLNTVNNSKSRVIESTTNHLLTRNKKRKINGRMKL